MPVDTPRAEYAEHIDQWQRCRDAREGADAVKARGEKYLPRLDSHKKGTAASALKYGAYLLRAYFYNAVGRTVEGLVGAVFQKPPTFEVPETIKQHLEDITLAGVSAEMFALEATEEAISIGRVGILVEMADDAAPEAKATRPYWATYEAEDIVSWRTERQNGHELLTRLVLKELDESPDPKDPFKDLCVTQYRVLELVPGEAGANVYTQTVYRMDETKREWAQFGEIVEPMRRGVKLDFIPFVFIGPTSMSPEVEKPPLLDLVDVNLSHYRNMATLEHGLHHTGTPTLVISDDKTQAANDDPIEYGAGVALVLSTAGKAEILQANGENLGALERAAERKKHDMSTLGAALLEDQGGKAQETATAVAMRQAGKHATLRTIATSVEQGLSLALRIHAWWIGTGDLEAVKASVELNKEFFAIRLTPEEAFKLVNQWQAGGASWATTYYNLQRGGMTRPDVTAEEERAEIEREDSMRPEPEPAPVPEPPAPEPKAA